MERATNQLTETEVRERLKSCKDPNTIDELYSFGRALVDQVKDDIQRIDTKAASLAAYAGAIITLLVSSLGSWSRPSDRWMALLVLAASVAAIIALVSAIRGLYLRTFEWFSQKEWLEVSCFEDVYKLKRFRILTMWGVICSHRNAHVLKVAHVMTAQRALALLLIALGLGLSSIYFGHNLRLP